MRIDVMTGVAPNGKREPVEFVLGARHVAVEFIIDRWFGAGYRYFKLRGRDGALYILRHDEKTGDWEMTLFERAPPSALAMPPRPGSTASSCLPTGLTPGRGSDRRTKFG